MGEGIVICGLNGAGKSTLGNLVAKRLNACFIDAEDLFFSGAGAQDPYASPRSPEEAGQLLLEKAGAHEKFVFACVKAGYARALYPLFRCVVLIDVPREVRMQRVQSRSFEKFGSRMLPGGDMYEQESCFLRFVKSRPENTSATWAQSLGCPVIQVDGTRPLPENADFIIRQLQTPAYGA